MKSFALAFTISLLTFAVAGQTSMVHTTGLNTPNKINAGMKVTFSGNCALLASLLTSARIGQPGLPAIAPITATIARRAMRPRSASSTVGPAG